MLRRVVPRLTAFGGRTSLRSAGPIPLEPVPSGVTSVPSLHEIVLASSSSRRLFGGSVMAALLSLSGVTMFSVCYSVNVLGAVLEAAYREDDDDADDDDD